MNGMRKTRGSNERGSALFVVLVMAVLLAGVLSALSVSTVDRSKTAERSNMELERIYMAQAGIERVKMALMENTGGGVNWLADQVANHGPNSPVHTFTMGNYTIQTFVEDLGTDPTDPWLTWYLLRATATDPSGKVAEIGLTTQLMDSFSKFIIFTDNNLNIGDFARFSGDLHSNANIGIIGQHTTYLGNVTAHGSIWFYNSAAQQTATFAKQAVSGVPKIARPSVSDIQDVGQDPPPGALVYDWNDSAFRTKFKNATGKYPNSSLVTDIKIDRDTLTITNYSKVGGKWYSMTETVPVPNNNILYSAGKVYIQGHLSRRMSVFTPKTITITNQIRYVDDNDQPQYIVYKSNGQPANFNSSKDMWSPTINWKGSNMDYREADDWVNRIPVVDGAPQNPSLGLVAGGTIYIDNANKNFPKNTEIHAMLYSATSIERPTKTWDPNGHNLVILGGMVITGTCPNSGAWHFRHYTYDEHLRSAPPPGFPSLFSPKFSNWHIRRTE